MKDDILRAKSIAYYSGLNGLEIKKIEYGIEDYVLCVSGAWCGKKQAHKVKINYNKSGAAYIRIHGYKIPLDECIRMEA